MHILTHTRTHTHTLTDFDQHSFSDTHTFLLSSFGAVETDSMETRVLEWGPLYSLTYRLKVTHTHTIFMIRQCGGKKEADCLRDRHL